MGFKKGAISMVIISAVIFAVSGMAWGQQVWTKCHITCRCLQDNSVPIFLLQFLWIVHRILVSKLIWLARVTVRGFVRMDVIA